MPRGEPVMCPACGWTGQQTELEGAACPACGEGIEDGP